MLVVIVNQENKLLLLAQSASYNNHSDRLWSRIQERSMGRRPHAGFHNIKQEHHSFNEIIEIYVVHVISSLF